MPIALRSKVPVIPRPPCGRLQVQRLTTAESGGAPDSSSMAKGSFGALLQQERDMRELWPDEPTMATRIAPEFLEALEEESWEKLPGGIFSRGLVRDRALPWRPDDENFLDEYDLAFSQRKVEVSSFEERFLA